MFKNYVLSMGIRGVSGVVGLNALFEKMKACSVYFENNEVRVIPE